MRRAVRFLIYYKQHTKKPVGVEQQLRDDFMALSLSTIASLKSYVNSHTPLQTDPDAEGVFHGTTTQPNGDSSTFFDEITNAAGNKNTYSSTADWCFGRLHPVAEYGFEAAMTVSYQNFGNGKAYNYKGTLKNVFDGSVYTVTGNAWGIDFIQITDSYTGV